MTTSTSFSKEQRTLLNRILFERMKDIDAEMDQLRFEKNEVRDIQFIVGPSYDPEDVAFQSRCS